MRTDFTAEQLADPDTAQSEKILRTCTHCGFCTATCPTYVLLGDELDSPRGRIYLIKDMLARDEPPGAETVKHIDRCLSCLSCMTTCPSGVNYMHLVDHARRWIEAKLPPALARSRIAGAARRGADPAVAASFGPPRGRPGQAVHPIFAGAAGAAAGARAGLDPCRLPDRSAAGVSGDNRATAAGGVAARLRPAGA